MSYYLPVLVEAKALNATKSDDASRKETIQAM
jgi:hypothetical protein